MKRAEIERVLDNPEDRKSELARALREERAITLRQFAELCGFNMRQAQGALMKGGLEFFKDPVTGETVITTKSVQEYLTRKIERAEFAELAEENAKRSAEAEAYGDGPAVVSVKEYAWMAGVSEAYVRQALHQGRIPGIATRDGYMVSGPFARWMEAEFKRRSAAAAATGRAQVAPDDNGWVPVEEAARLLDTKPEYFRPGAAVTRGHARGLVMRRIPGRGWCVGGPGLQLMLEAKRARDAKAEAEQKFLAGHAKQEGSDE